MLVLHLESRQIPEPASSEAKAVVPGDGPSINFQLADLQPSRVRQQIAELPQERTTLRADQRTYPVARQKPRNLGRDDRLKAGSNLLRFGQVNHSHRPQSGEFL